MVRSRCAAPIPGEAVVSGVRVWSGVRRSAGTVTGSCTRIMAGADSAARSAACQGLITSR